MTTKIDPNEHVADLAEAILKVGDAGTRLLNSNLSKRAIVVLIKDLTPNTAIADITAVLDALPYSTPCPG